MADIVEQLKVELAEVRTELQATVSELDTVEKKLHAERHEVQMLERDLELRDEEIEELKNRLTPLSPVQLAMRDLRQYILGADA